MNLSPELRGEVGVTSRLSSRSRKFLLTETLISTLDSDINVYDHLRSFHILYYDPYYFPEVK